MSESNYVAENYEGKTNELGQRHGFVNIQKRRSFGLTTDLRFLFCD